MVKRRQYPNKRQQRTQASRSPTPTISSETLAERRAQPKREYGPPIILLENENLETFQYVRGAWVPYAERIAECRLDCQVSALPQKVNKMTRYEVRLPIE